VVYRAMTSVMRTMDDNSDDWVVVQLGPPHFKTGGGDVPNPALRLHHAREASKAAARPEPMGLSTWSIWRPARPKKLPLPPRTTAWRVAESNSPLMASGPMSRWLKQRLTQ
jgi:hypothetical protein